MKFKRAGITMFAIATLTSCQIEGETVYSSYEVDANFIIAQSGDNHFEKEFFREDVDNYLKDSELSLIGPQYTDTFLNVSFLFKPSELLEIYSEAFIELVNINEWEEWYFNFEEKAIPTTLSETANLYSFITHFQISDNDILTASKKAKAEGYTHGKFGHIGFPITDEQIESLLTRNEEKVLSAFISDFAIRKENNFYTPEWLFYNDIDSYERVGLNPKEVANVLRKCRESVPFIFDTGIDTLEKKLYNFAISIGTPLTSMEISGFDKDLEMPLPFVSIPNDFSVILKFRNPFMMDFAANYFLIANSDYPLNYYHSDEMSKFREWYKKFDGNMIMLTDLNGFPNIYSAVLEFGFEPEKFFPDDDYYKEIVPSIKNRDENSILKHYVDESVLVKNDSFYTFAWVYYNKPSAYAQAGITPEELLEMLPRYETLGILTDEAWAALENKIFDYAIDVESGE